MNHTGAEDTENARSKATGDTESTRVVIGAAIEVHRVLGPGLLESVYQAALAYELQVRGLEFAIRKQTPVRCKGRTIGASFVADTIVESRSLLELKSVRRVETVHEAQILSCLRLAKIRSGPISNFRSATMRDGIRRLVPD